MALTPFTSNDEVRGVLGVSPKEVRDDLLDLGIYEINLRYALNNVNAAIVAQFLAINIITPVSTRTALQVTFYEAVKLYSPYVVAYQMMPGLPMLAPKDITDGKAAVGKFSESPFKAMTAAISIEHDKYQNNLALAYSALFGNATSDALIPTLFKGVSSAIDRVTNSAR